MIQHGLELRQDYIVTVGHSRRRDPPGRFEFEPSDVVDRQYGEARGGAAGSGRSRRRGVALTENKRFLV